MPPEFIKTQTWRMVGPPDALDLLGGGCVSPVDVAFETSGTLSPERDNAVLICHSLTGDSHVTGQYGPGDKSAWWPQMIGPGKAIDTEKYFVICANIIGGCKGTTGPASVNPATDRPYGLDFPMVTISDMVAVQHALVTQHLGLDRLLAAVGGSMGGMQVLQWALDHPEMLATAIPIATTPRLNAQGIAFDEVGRQAICSDPNWRGGAYYDANPPERGLAIARMIGHITYLSDSSMRAKFGRELHGGDELGYDFGPADFQVESYLRHQGGAFVRRFDANSYLYVTKAMDYYDPSGDAGSLVEALRGVRSRFLVVSYSGDWLFPTYMSKDMVRALQANGVETTFCELQSEYGHDAFLLEDPDLSQMVGQFLACAQVDLRAGEMLLSEGGRS